MHRGTYLLHQSLSLVAWGGYLVHRVVLGLHLASVVVEEHVVSVLLHIDARVCLSLERVLLILRSTSIIKA